MNETRLREIASRCDELMQDDLAILERVAISWLHILNEHPTNLQRYRSVESPRSWRSDVSREVRGIAQIARNILRAAMADALMDERDENLAPAQVLLVSQLVNERQLEAEDDFYFGRIQQLLADRGVSSLLLMRNHLAGPDRELRRSARREGQRARLLLPHTAGWKDEAQFAAAMFRTRRELMRETRTSLETLRRAVVREAARQAVSDTSIATLRLHRQIENICRLVRPEVVIVTYEGHAWERCAWDAARRVRPDVLCAGYQHTVLWKNSHAAKRLLRSERFDPDLVLTVGDVTREILDQTLEGIPIATVGTHRRADGGKPPIDVGERPRRCLVLPEGIESECVILFKFAIQCAQRLPDVTFTFRLHPLLTFPMLAAKYAFLRTLPANVELSAVSIDDDFKRSAYCLYRGSSTVIYAVLAGLRPVYLAREGEMPFDPLYELNVWRRVVTKPEDFFTQVIEPGPEDASAQRIAREFCHRYVLPVQAAGLEPVLAFLDARQGASNAQ